MIQNEPEKRGFRIEKVMPVKLGGAGAVETVGFRGNCAVLSVGIGVAWQKMSVKPTKKQTTVNKQRKALK